MKQALATLDLTIRELEIILAMIENGPMDYGIVSPEGQLVDEHEYQRLWAKLSAAEDKADSIMSGQSPPKESK